ncbi:hypothetical protein Tco_0282748 [Tanacetum coccineum]
MSTPKFAETHNLVAFLEKPEESNGFEQIIDILNASSIKYALTVNPTVYESCIKQFWATAKAKTVNGERQIQALVDKKKVIITEKSVRSDLVLDDTEGTELFLDKQVEGMSKHKGIYVTPSNTKKVFANMKRPGKDFSGKGTPLFKTMLIQAPEDMEPIPDEATNEEPISTPSYDPPQSGEDRLQLTELMNFCTKLQKQALDLKEAKTDQAKEIASLKKRVKQLEKRKKSRTSGLKRLRKVGSASRVESSNDVSLGAQEDASKQGRKIADLDADEEVTLIDETLRRNDEDLMNDDNPMFDTGVLDEQEVIIEKEVNEKEVSAADPVPTAGEIKEAKPKAVTTAATTVTPVSSKPKAKGIVFHDQEKQTPVSIPIISSSQPSQAKDKGKAKMVDHEKPLKKKDQIALDEDLALRLHAKEQAELEKMQKERVAQEEASRAAIFEELDSIQAMIEADEQLAARLQAEEQEQFSIEKSQEC